MAALPELERKLLTCDDYHAMIAAGILSEEDKLELINGELIIMSPTGPKHRSVVGRIDALLQRLLEEKAIVFTQSPITLAPLSEPEPDLVIVKPRPDFYAEAHPVPDDLFWLIEVSDAMLEKDRLVKGPLYAQAKVPVYWIANLVDHQLEVYAQPKQGQYTQRRILLPEEHVTLPGFEMTVEVGKLLG